MHHPVNSLITRVSLRRCAALRAIHSQASGCKSILWTSRAFLPVVLLGGPAPLLLVRFDIHIETRSRRSRTGSASVRPQRTKTYAGSISDSNLIGGC
jgi:hypothetical protein